MQQQVVDASRDFVCIRCATYEDQAEADFMKSIWLDRTGLLKNTTWAILTPDGTKKLTRAGRGPFHEYRNATDMANGMNEIASKYKSESAGSDARLPFTASVELGLNISAADTIPMVVLVGSDPKTAEKLEEKVLALAWKDQSIIGQFNYGKAATAEELSMVTGIDGDLDQLNGILIIEPGQFGLSGKVLEQLDSETSTDDLKAAMLKGIANCERIAKTEYGHDSHVELGIKLGIDWKTKIPETDNEALDRKKHVRGE